MNNKLYNSNTKNPKALKHKTHCVCSMHVKMKEPFSYSTEYEFVYGFMWFVVFLLFGFVLSLV